MVGVIRKKAAISIAYVLFCKLTFSIPLGEYLAVGQSYMFNFYVCVCKTFFFTENIE